MPKNKDADDVIRESPQRWQELVNSAKRWEDFVFDTVIDSLDLETVEGKTEARNRLLPYIDAMPDPVRQSHYLQKLSRLIQVDERTLKAWVRSLRIGRGGRRLKDVSETSFDIPMASPRDPLEEYCLYLLLSYPELGDKAAALLPHHFERVENRAIFEVVHGDWNVESLPQRIDASLQEHLDSLLGANWPPVKEEVRESALTDCIRRLEERRLKGMKRQEALMWQEGSRQDLPHIEELSYHMWCSGDADVEGVDGDLLHLAELHRKGIEVNQQLKRIHASERSKTRLRRIETNSEKRANP